MCGRGGAGGACVSIGDVLPGARLARAGLKVKGRGQLLGGEVRSLGVEDR